MRFYHEIKDVIIDHLFDIIEEPWNVFATDLLYFLACEHETGWIPYRVQKEFEDIPIPTPRNYTPHPLSPFTNTMRRTIKYGVIPPDHEFVKTYKDIVAPGVEHSLALFVEHVIQAFEDFFAAERTMNEMYMMLLYAGKMATIFHLQGTTDAPQLALTLIANALNRLGTKVPLNKAFEAMEHYAVLICRVYHEDKPENS